MIGEMAVAGGLGLAAGIGIAAWRERRWRRLAALELAEEVEIGSLSPADLRALSSGGRFRRAWLRDPRERRVFRRIAARLARAKDEQRRAADARRKLLQVEVLTLRTRLRRAAGPADTGADGAAEDTVVSSDS